MANEQHDPRYARQRTVYAVMYWDKHDSPEMICETEQLARDYVAGQWSVEYYSIKPITLIENLPERRPLYIYSGIVPYPAGDPTGDYDEYSAQGEFPGIGNGAMVPLDEVKADLSHHNGGWHISVVGWDQEEVEAEAAGLRDAALRQRAKLVEVFAPYGNKALVQVGGNGPHAGKLLTRRGSSWADTQAPPRLVGPIYDHDLDPADFSTITFGEPKTETP